jgi:hypothetical protein
MNTNPALFVKSILSAILAVVPASSIIARADRPANDNLVFASTMTSELRYEKLLAQKLFKTPSDLGRALVCPPFEGEFALSIYSTATTSDVAMFAMTRAEKNIWYAATDLDRELRVSPNVAVKSVTATIKRPVALAVADAIGYALAGTRPLVPVEAIPVHATRIQFFAPTHAKTKLKSALLEPVSQGKLSQALRRLVTLLESYCVSSSTARKQLSKEIEAQARLISGMK